MVSSTLFDDVQMTIYLREGVYFVLMFPSPSILLQSIQSYTNNSDLMNHHNGKINTKLERDSEGGLRVIALTDISANSPIYNTYARSGWETTVDTFNTYGFVEDYPQLWVWTDDKLVQMTQDNKEHAFQRYRNDVHDEGAYDRSHYVPNSHHYEILVLSPTVGALYPTQGLVGIIGNGQRSMEEWQLLFQHDGKVREKPYLVDSLIIMSGTMSSLSWWRQLPHTEMRERKEYFSISQLPPRKKFRSKEDLLDRESGFNCDIGDVRYHEYRYS